MRFIDDVISFSTMVLLPIAAILAVVIVGMNAYGNYQCSNYSQITGKKTTYANFDMCYVETESGFQRWDEYKARSVAIEGLKHD